MGRWGSAGGDPAHPLRGEKAHSMEPLWAEPPGEDAPGEVWDSQQIPKASTAPGVPGSVLLVMERVSACHGSAGVK